MAVEVPSYTVTSRVNRLVRSISLSHTQGAGLQISAGLQAIGSGYVMKLAQRLRVSV